MIGMIIVTHGRLAEEFIRATEHVVGPQQNVDTICIGPNDDIFEGGHRIQASLGVKLVLERLVLGSRGCPQLPAATC